MKKISLSAVYKFFLLFLFGFIQLIAGAQDSTSTSRSTTITKETTTTTDWYMEPWVWAVGGSSCLFRNCCTAACAGTILGSSHQLYKAK